MDKIMSSNKDLNAVEASAPPDVQLISYNELRKMAETARQGQQAMLGYNHEVQLNNTNFDSFGHV